ncbi:MAG: flagellar biosynthetic protein FliO [Pseudomonadota bacterium]
MLLEDGIRVLGALAFVLSLIGVCGLVAKRIGISRGAMSNGQKKLLSVSESLALGPRQKLLLVSCKEKDHLILLDEGRSLLIDSTVREHDASKAELSPQKTKPSMRIPQNPFNSSGASDIDMGERNAA